MGSYYGKHSQESLLTNEGMSEHLWEMFLSTVKSLMPREIQHRNCLMYVVLPRRKTSLGILQIRARQGFAAADCLNIMHEVVSLSFNTKHKLHGSIAVKTSNPSALGTPALI